jgi:VanZ family protein
MPPSRFRKAAFAAALIWTAAIFLLCLWPGDQLPKTEVPFADKWTHLILFGGFSLLWLLASGRKNAGWLLRMVLIAAALGWLIECLQGWLTFLNRSQDAVDAFADALGGLLGVLAYLLLTRSLKSQKSRSGNGQTGLS